MDIGLARTFLTVAETGTFVDAAKRMNLTQSTVSARIKTLEDQLGQPLFHRSKYGAELTNAGEQFRRHALTLVRVWQHAQFEVGLADQHRDRLFVGATYGLWQSFLVEWVAWLRSNLPDIAVSATAETETSVTEKMTEGTLDLAVTYRPLDRPGLITEHLFNDVFVRVTSAPRGTRRRTVEPVFLNWGPDLKPEDAIAEPEFLAAGLTLDVGAGGLDYLLHRPCTGYVPQRVARTLALSGKVRIVPRTHRFSHPVFISYPETRDEAAYEPILSSLKNQANAIA
ncbi:MAG: LysR family transcriptional regulator [Hyphomicrobiaceae bacterium]